MSIGYSDIWVGGGVDEGWVGKKVLLRWMPSRKEKRLALFYQRCCCGGCPREKRKGWHCFTIGVAAVDALAAVANDDGDDDGDDDDDDDDDDDNDAFLGLKHL